MKKMLMMAVLVVSQIAFSATEVKRLTSAEAQSRVERSATFKKIEDARASRKDISKDTVLMKSIDKMLELTLKDVTTMSSESISKLLMLDAKSTLSEIARLSSIAKDKSSSEKEVANAKKALELIEASANGLKSLADNEADATKQKEELAFIIENAVKISAFDYNASAKEFVKAFEAALEEGKSPREALKIAGKGKITEEQIKSCDI